MNQDQEIVRRMKMLSKPEYEKQLLLLSGREALRFPPGFEFDAIDVYAESFRVAFAGCDTGETWEGTPETLPRLAELAAHSLTSQSASGSTGPTEGSGGDGQLRTSLASARRSALRVVPLDHSLLLLAHLIPLSQDHMERLFPFRHAKRKANHQIGNLDACHSTLIASSMMELVPSSHGPFSLRTLRDHRTLITKELRSQPFPAAPHLAPSRMGGRHRFRGRIGKLRRHDEFLENLWIQMELDTSRAQLLGPDQLIVPVSAGSDDRRRWLPKRVLATTGLRAYVEHLVDVEADQAALLLLSRSVRATADAMASYLGTPPDETAQATETVARDFDSWASTHGIPGQPELWAR